MLMPMSAKTYICMCLYDKQLVFPGGVRQEMMSRGRASLLEYDSLLKAGGGSDDGDDGDEVMSM